jgi:hypothetical protein
VEGMTGFPVLRGKRGPVKEGINALFRVFLNDASSKWQRVSCGQVAGLERVRERLKSSGVGV